MYRASVGLLALGFVALVVGWVANTQPAIYAAMVIIGLAFIFLILSILQDRRKRRSPLVDETSDARSSAWIASPAVRSETPAPSRRGEGAGSAGYEAPFRRTPEPASGGGWSGSLDDSGSTMAMPFPVPADADESNRRRFGRKSRPVDPGPLPSDTGAGAVEQLHTFTQAASAGLRSFEPDEPESTEQRLARATEEAEALLSLPVSLRDEEEPPAPAPRAPEPPAAAYRAPAPRPPAGQTRREQDEWLEAAMRRRQARAAGGPAEEGAEPAQPAQPAQTRDAGPRDAGAPAPAPEPAEPAVVPWSVRRRRAAGATEQSTEEPTVAPGPAANDEPTSVIPAPQLRPRPSMAPEPEPEPEPAIAPWRERQSAAAPPAPRRRTARRTVAGDDDAVEIVPAPSAPGAGRPRRMVSSFISPEPPPPPPAPRAKAPAAKAAAAKPAAAKPVPAKPVPAKAAAPKAAAKAPAKAAVKAPAPAPAKPVAKAAPKVPAKVPAKAQAEAPAKAQAKAPAKAQAKAPAKAQAKAPAKAQAKAPAKAQAKAATKAPANAATKAPANAATKAPANAAPPTRRWPSVLG